MTVMPLEWVLGRDRVDNMAPIRTTSSQNSQANNDVPLPFEGLYLETLAGLAKRQARAIETQALGQHSSSKGSSFDDFNKLDCSEEQKASYAAFIFNNTENNKGRGVGVMVPMRTKNQKESGAYFGCGKHGHMIRDCPKNKKFMIGKPKEENKEDKQKPRMLKPLLMWRHVLFEFAIGKVVFAVAYLKAL
ncbi:hypothetical protein AAG906_001312 [Vitis piasezkii]